MVIKATTPSVPRPRACPPRIDANEAIPAPNPARNTLVSGSVIAKNATATPMAIRDLHHADAPNKRAARAQTAIRTATLKPLIAST